MNKRVKDHEYNEYNFYNIGYDDYSTILKLAKNGKKPLIGVSDIFNILLTLLSLKIAQGNPKHSDCLVIAIPLKLSLFQLLSP